MLSFIMRSNLLQNFFNVNKLRMATIAYQFRVDRPCYYPNRQIEQRTSQLTKTPEKPKLPKDYYYKILGVRKSATTPQIKAAYYALAKRFHPDASKYPQEAKRFQEISNAYHILTDEMKRLEYDQLGSIKDETNFLKSVENNVNKMQKMGKKLDSNVATASEDLAQMNSGEARLELTFLEAAHGLNKKVDLRILKKCPACNGKSAKLAGRPNVEMCRKCNGTGQLTRKSSTYSNVIVCDQCQGKRFVNRNQCVACENRGVVVDTVRVSVLVPPGVKTGDIVPIDNPKNNQRVNYRIQVKESEYFHRVGNDVHTDKYLTISEAVLGGIFKVRGIYDDIEVKVEPGTESHTKTVIKGKGIKYRGSVGDHVITFKVRIPRNLSVKQRQLIVALAKAEEPTFQNAT